jgi:hypothetical protein
MNDLSIAESIRCNIWVHNQHYDSCGVATMLSQNELKMLSWLGQNFNFELDDFVADLGSFLGGSTRALANGVAHRPRRAQNAERIQSYDMFKVPDDDYSRGMIGMDRPLGSSVVDIFQTNISGYEDIVQYHAGDVRAAPVPQRALAIAFIDIAKSQDLNEYVVQKFFDLLVPGKSIVIQQDHNDHSCPWIAVTMEYLKDNFEYLTDESSSRVFLNTSKVPGAAAAEIAALTLDDQCILVEAAAAGSKNPVSGYLVLVSKAWLIHKSSGLEPALAFLAEIKDRQPWGGDPYVDIVAGALRYVSEIGGMEVYLAGYFRE